MKFILSIVLLIFCSVVQAQSKDDIAFQKLKTYYNSHSTHYKNAPPSDFYYNKFNKSIVIGSIELPFLDLSVSYSTSDGINFVAFKCKGETIEDGNCLKSFDYDGSYKYVSGLAFGFNTKDDCYGFISLLADFKNTVK